MWKVEWQEESKGRAGKVPTLVKTVKHFPFLNGGRVEGFGRLKNPLLQILLRSSAGYELKLRLDASEGVNYPKFSITHPDGLDYPKIWVGEKKKRRQITDLLAPKQRIPGDKERYDSYATFEARVKQIAGDGVATEVMDLFSSRVVAKAA